MIAYLVINQYEKKFPTDNDTIISTVVSPDKHYTAIIYVRDWGATTNYVTGVFLRSDSTFHQLSDKIILTIDGETSIEVKWISNKEVIIQCDKAVRHRMIKTEPEIRFITSQWKDVKISYRYAR